MEDKIYTEDCEYCRMRNHKKGLLKARCLKDKDNKIIGIEWIENGN